MGLLRRLGTGLGHALAAADDPRPPEVSLLQRQTELQQSLRQALTENSVSQQRLTTRIGQLGAQRARLYVEARNTLQRGREELAALLLQQRYAAAQEEQRFQAQLDALAAEGRQLLLAEQQLSMQIQALYARWETAAARQTAAEVQLQVSETASDIALEFAALASGIDRVDERTLGLQARGQALNEIATTGPGPHGGLPAMHGVEQEIAGAVAATEIAAELALLRQEIAGAASTSAPGGPPKQERAGA